MGHEPGGSGRSGESFGRGMDGQQWQVPAGDDVERRSPQHVKTIGSAGGDGQWAECIRIVPRRRSAPGQRGEVG